MRMLQDEEEPYYIVESKKNCVELGMDPNEIRHPKNVMTDRQLKFKREAYREILSVIHFFSDKILDSLNGVPILIVISDQNGFLLDMVGDQTIKATVNQLGIRVGAQFTQENMGTNVVSLALQQRHPIQLIGSNHYHTYLHGTACYGLAFHYTDINDLLGSICIMTALELHNPIFSTMLSTTVDSIERELLLKKKNRQLDILNQIMLRKNRNGIIITDPQGKITSVNDFASSKITFEKDSNVLDCNQNSSICNYMSDVIKEGKNHENIQLHLIDKDNQPFVCLFDAQPIHDEDQKLIGSFAQLRDITERYLVEEKNNYLAYHDELTSLPNRRLLKEMLHRSIYEMKDTNLDLALAFLDLDNFKNINDAFGHSSGDILLKQVAERLSESLDGNAEVFRMGGDEFIFLFINVKDENDANRIGKKIIDLFNTPFVINDSSIHVSASIGIALYPNDGTDAETFMVQADNAMYKSKSKGRNDYTLFKSEMSNTSKSQLSLETSLRKALENKEFVLHYQPKVDLQNKKIVGLEALLRWNHPEQGVIYPDKFIPILEQSGMISQVGEWVLNEACLQSVKWQEQGLPPMKVAVNLSSQQFLKDNLIDVVERALYLSKLKSHLLELEITETMTMDVDRAINILGKLNSLGVKIGIDDFGTGYSSLNYLKRFSIHTLKIDKSFVRDIMTDRNDANIVSTIISMAHNMNLDVIAEGVETIEQVKFLQSKKCDVVQGYYFSKPMSAHDFTKNFVKINDEIKNKTRKGWVWFK